ncbi:Quinidine resistance protein 1 [Cytospora mali]|uniref:Quinidine resistance protein 1 n=1 Tax=Cytospora mali TaxID=578113 RepID=A0A194VY09_CYTMA|nr:Quinidine resistance protein 1 [Valsa mali]
MYFPLIPMLSRHFNVSIQAIHLTVAVYAFFQAVSPGFFASLADSFGRRPVLLGLICIYSVASLGLALNKNSYAALVALRALQSIGGSATVPMSYGIAADVAPSAERGGMLGPMMSTCNAVSALGPVIGVGGIIAGKLIDVNYAKTAKADSTAPNFPIERARFRNCWPVIIFLEVALVVGFGWAVRYLVHPAVPLILEFFAVGVSTVLSRSASALLVYIFPDASSTAYASGQIARCGLSAASVAVLQPISYQQTITTYSSNTCHTTTMRAAVVTTFGQPPQYTSVSDPPSPSPGHLRLRVLAVGVPNVARAIAAGKHFLTASLPYIPGIDGVGVDDSASPPRKYYFSTLPPSPGSLSEHVNMDQKALVPLPDDVDEKSVAALANPAQSSWMAIRHRTSDLPEGWSVAVLGATSASGRVAVRIARALGAGRIIGIARGERALAEVEGLDERIVLDGEDPARTDFSALGGQVDVVLDYVYGPAVVALLSSLRPTREVQYVQIGTLGGGDVALPGALLRSKMIVLRGSGPGSWTMTQLAGETTAILKAVVDLKADSLHVARLKDVESFWNSPDVKGKRLVFIP